MLAADPSRHRLSAIVWVCLALLLGLAACGDRDTNSAQSVNTVGVTETLPTATVSPSPVRDASPTTVPTSTLAADASPTPPPSKATIPPPLPGRPDQPVITALDAATGTARWQHNLVTLSDLLVGGDALYFIDETQSLVALDLITGTERWRVPVPNSSALNVADETTVYLDVNGAVHAINAAAGQERWVATGFVALAAGDGIVVGWSSPDTGLRVLDAETGQDRWAVPVGNTGLTGLPIIAGDTVYVGLPASERGGEGVYALDVLDGTIRWTVEIPSGQAIDVEAGNVVIFSFVSTREVFAVDQASGQERWRHTIRDESSGIEQVVSSDDSVYIIAPGWDIGSPVVALELQTGAVRWEAVSYRPPIGATTRLIVVMADHPSPEDASQVEGLDELTGTPTWSYASGDLRELVVSETTVVVSTWE